MWFFDGRAGMWVSAPMAPMPLRAPLAPIRAVSPATPLAPLAHIYETAARTPPARRHVGESIHLASVDADGADCASITNVGHGAVGTVGTNGAVSRLVALAPKVVGPPHAPRQGNVQPR